MKLWIYNQLVNRQPGISRRYHLIHDNTTGLKKYASWLYLLWLNFAYYILGMHFLGKSYDNSIYEEKKLNIHKSESLSNSIYVKSLLEKSGVKYDRVFTDYREILLKYDVISFDVFDTLIFRPFDKPADIFDILALDFGIMDFKNIRKAAEYKARTVCKEKNGHMEVSLLDIWKLIEKETGINASLGAKKEEELEYQFCYGNPFMKKLYNDLKKEKKTIIAVTDMYLSRKVIESILQKNGFYFDNIFVSNEYKKSKASIDLFYEVKKIYGKKSIIHIGDSEKSDLINAKDAGIFSLLYPKTNTVSNKYRPFDMSCITGSAYRGIVAGHIYNALKIYSPFYEYGFIYGGLFVTGYCNFIHENIKNNSIDTLLFLSRDGDVLKKAYEYLYTDEIKKNDIKIYYTYWSRKAAVKLMAMHDKNDYFKRFLYHKSNQKITIKEILNSMEIKPLYDLTDDFRNSEIYLDSYLTDKNINRVKEILEAHFDKIIEIYEPQNRAAKTYFKALLKDSKKACAVDIGWSGSGALSLSYLVEKVWNLNCQVTGIVAAGNSINNSEPDISEPFFQSKKLVSYMFSQGENRDLFKKHDPSKDYNVYWELLLSSPTPSFDGFYPYKYDKEKKIYLENLDIILGFSNLTENPKISEKIQKGILDFVRIYKRHFENHPFMFDIKGRDAYAPMMIACSNNEKYLKNLLTKVIFYKNIT
ncbi:haloacid dehalogenase superfamily, subfamily IA, variant 1 with third motif having Dx(3-4)D or Dx(3-4)E [Acetitomaculum ruminis DSM 5522]|uniref:Haloacid dehalogenase superfamily, subfamily IA, variant 1 with third motif having Dx(3-4)D or Dx(3-4)E n=1 Tax=Acetitomaculum ruminis DSM 5522 TaxID=1120918 RepID=A0A1I0VKC6_9FIRM|nr:HAD-IA family hydrolase [Acetitomaculum ruminis]SFA76477.1 haloacid dehalogenase superfamily, subfamily IA, variant 1 with third motif having Dx(3-4)D or Dx(3-4)E [Acetitomaculum ruminis DSM 5522]